MFKRHFSILILTLIFSSSCALRKPATAITADIIDRGMIEMESEEDLFVARDTVLPLIKVMEVLHRGDPKNRRFNGLLSKAYASYAFGFAELEAMKDPHPRPQRLASKACMAGGLTLPLTRGGNGREWLARAKRFYAKGRDHGLTAISDGSLAEMPFDKFRRRLKRFGRKDAANLFWTAFNWGSYVNLSRDDIIAAADLPRVELLIDRVIGLKPDFQCGAPYAFKGVLIAGNPFRRLGGVKPRGGHAAFRGQDKAKEYFETAMSSCNGNFLMNKVMYAEWYLKAVGDEALYKKTLEEVIAAEASVLPEHRLVNELAKERAGALLINDK